MRGRARQQFRALAGGTADARPVVMLDITIAVLAHALLLVGGIKILTATAR
jgi:hypothetical protein